MSDYLARTRAQCSIINSLAFPNVLKKVNDIYVPLTLSALDSMEENEFTVRKGDVFLEQFKNILIIDNAGMGKSTLMKKLLSILLISLITFLYILSSELLRTPQ